MSDASAQLIELQTRLAYQDDTLHKLNEVVVRHEQQIDQLTQALRRLSQQMQSLREGGGGADPAQELPPHY